MTKNSEIKWDKTKGNRNVSIKPLSSSGDLQSPVWGSDRGVGAPQDPIGSGLSLELHMLVHQSWIRRERSKTNPSSNFHCYHTHYTPNVFFQIYSWFHYLWSALGG